MKKIMLLFILGSSVAASAQNGIYLEPMLGIGQTNVKTNIVNAPLSVYHYSAQLGIGYQKNKWRLESGLRYFTTGYKTGLVYFYENSVYFPGIWNPPDYQEVLIYRHIELPLKVGYEIKLAHKLFFVPMVGVSASYNVSAHERREMSGKVMNEADLSARDFDARYQRYSAWANLALNLEYKVSKRINFAAALQGDYMFTSILKPHVYYNRSTQNNYAYSFKLGVKWRLKRQNDYQYQYK